MEPIPKFFQNPRSDCIDEIYSNYEHKESALNEAIKRFENITKSAAETTKTHKNGVSMQLLEQMFHECPEFVDLLLLSGFSQELDRLKFDESKRGDLQKSLKQLKDRNDGENSRCPRIRRNHDGNTVRFRHSNVENSEPIIAESNEDSNNTEQIRQKPDALPLKKENKKFDPNFMDVCTPNKSHISSTRQRQTSIFNGTAPILTAANTIIDLPRTDGSIWNGVKMVKFDVKNSALQIQDKPLREFVIDELLNEKGVKEFIEFVISKEFDFGLVKDDVNDEESDLKEVIPTALFEEIRALIYTQQQMEIAQLEKMCKQLRNELAQARTMLSLAVGIAHGVVKGIYCNANMLPCFVQPTVTPNNDIRPIKTDAVNPTQSDHCKTMSMAQNLKALMKGEIEPKDMTEMEEKTETEVSDMQRNNTRFKPETMVQKREDEHKCESKAQFTPIKFNNYAKNHCYISRAKIAQMMELCPDTFLTSIVNDGSLALNYFQQSVLIQINDGQICVIKTGKGDVIVIINIDLTFNTGETMYLIAVQNDIKYRHRVKWKIEAFLSATVIQKTFALTKMPSSSRNMPQFISALGTVPTNDVICNVICKTDLTKVWRTKMPKELLPITEITARKFKLDCQTSANNGIMVPCVVVKGKSHWIEWKKIVTFRDCNGQKQSIMISLRYLTANKQWIIACLDYDIGRVYYQHRLVGTNHKYCYSWNDLYESITTVLKIV